MSRLRLEMGEGPIGLLSTTVKPHRPTEMDLVREQLQSGQSSERPNGKQSGENTERPVGKLSQKKGKNIFGQKNAAEKNGGQNNFRQNNVGQNNFGQSNAAQNNFVTTPRPTPTPSPIGTTISLGGPQNDQVKQSHF